MVFPMIKKDTTEVVIRTLGEKIEGTLYKVPASRLLDTLNKTTETFLAVSNARVYEIETGKLSFEAKFLMVNKNHIVHITDSYSTPDL